MPSWCSWLRMVQNSRRETGSTPVVGSSSSSSSGSVSSADTSASFCFMPPESAPASRAAEAIEAHARQQVRRAGPRHCRRHVVELRAQREVLVDREVLVEAEALRHEAERADGRQSELAARRLQQARHQLEERRLAGSVRPDEREQFARARPAGRARAAPRSCRRSCGGRWRRAWELRSLETAFSRREHTQPSAFSLQPSTSRSPGVHSVSA